MITWPLVMVMDFRLWILVMDFANAELRKRWKIAAGERF
jgi:hypothetical protein